MKAFSKKFEIIVIVVVFLFGIFLRLYNFPNRLIFGPEQSLSLITSAEYLKEKFSLLGEAYIQRTTSAGHYLFHSALFGYSLLPLLLLGNFNPLPVTYFFAFLNLFTALLLFWLTQKYVNRESAILAVFFFLTSPVMVHHSLFIWTLNYLPLIGLLSFFLVWSFIKKPKPLNIFLLGLLSGIGFGLQFMYFFSALTIFIICLIFSNSKGRHLVYFTAGAVIGNFPMVIFDIKHNFFHLVTLWQYFQDIINHRVTGFTTYYQFLHFWPIACLILGVTVYKVSQFSRFSALIILLTFAFTNLRSPYINLNRSTGMAPGLTLSSFEKVGQAIADDHPPRSFNLATLLDFDTQSHPLRYILAYEHNLKAQPVEQYADLEALYVFAPKDYDIVKPQVWELKIYLPYQVSRLPSPSADYSLYKLTK